MIKITQAFIILFFGIAGAVTAQTISQSSQSSSSAQHANKITISSEMQFQIQEALIQRTITNSQTFNRAPLAATYIGSFNTNDGPNWGTNPPVLSAVQAAALIFGGDPSNYAISTNPNTTDPSTITETAWATTWGVGGCQEVAQDYFLDLGAPGYNDPGGTNTATSAYVTDNCLSANTNYVWLVRAINCPEDITVSNDPGICGAVVNYSVAANDPVDGPLTPIQTAGLPSGSVFPVGVTTNTFEVTYSNGTTESCSFDVTVNDTEAPVISCPGNITQANDPGECGAVVNYTVTATDNCSGVGACITEDFETYVLPAGSAIDIGVMILNETTVANGQGPGLVVSGCTYSSLDGDFQWNAAGYFGQVSRNIVAGGSDSTIRLEYDDTVGAVDFNLSAFDGYSDTATIQAFDIGGISLGVVGPLAIPDATPVPVSFAIAGIKTIVIVGTRGWSPLLNDHVFCPDSGGIAPVQTAGLPSGSTFPVGTTTNTFEVTDASGITTTCSFDVIVEDNEAPVAMCVAPITIALDANGEASLTTAMVDNGSTDNCNDITFTFSETFTAFAQVNEGQNLTITLPAGAVVEAVDFASYGTPNGSNGNYTIGACHAANSQSIVESYALGNNTFTIPALNGVFGDPCGGTFKRLYVAVSYSTEDTELNFTCADIGDTTLTLKVTDASGNTSTCSTVVTIIDDLSPEIICVANQMADTDAGACTYTHSGTAWDATATDNCSSASLEYELTGATTGTGTTLDGVAFNLGETMVTWTTTDGSGNMEDCSFTVTVVNATPPVITAPADITVNTDAGVCFATNVDLGNPVITEICESILLGWDMENAVVGQVIIPPSYTDPLVVNADLSGGQGIELFIDSNVYMTRQFGDVSKPVFNITLNEEVFVNIFRFTHIHNHNPGFPTNPSYFAQLQMDAGGTGNYVDIGDPVLLSPATAFNTDEIHLNTLLPIGNTSFRFNAVGLNGSSNTGSEYFALDNVEITYGVSTTNDAPLEFPLGDTTVTWTATDSNGNMASDTQIVTVEDNEAPQITCVADQTMNIDAGFCSYTHNGTTWDATATDNCSIATTEYVLTGATTGTGTTLDGVAFNLGVTTVTWTTTDGNGNTEECSFTVTIEDNEAPQIVCVANQTVDTDAGVCTYTHNGTAWDATATDNCSIATTEYELTGATTGTGITLDGVAFNLGVTTVTWTTTDGRGNTNDCSFTVTVEDNEAPQIVCVANQTVDTDTNVCTYTHSGTAWDAIATDNCSIATTTFELTGATTGTGTTLDGVTFNLGVTTVTWTTTDGSGNTNDCSFTVTVEDNQAPQIVCPLDIIINAEPGMCGAQVFFANATALDACSGFLPTVQTQGPVSGSFFPVGDTVISFSATDAAGNVATCSFTITVEDNQAPLAVCQNITIQLDSNGVATIVAEDLNGGSTDNCAGNLTYTASQTSFDCSNVGDNTITLTVTDEAGNSSTCTAIVTVEDSIAPVAMCAAPFTIQLDANGNASITTADIDNGSTDNCSGATITLSQSTFTCADLGENTITLTITDASGNTATCTTVVTVEDTIAPIVSCIDFTLELGPDGTALLTPEDIGGTSTDNCAITITAIDIENFDCMDIGTPVLVTYFASDASGNIASCTTMVTVVDMLGPVIDCPEDQTVDTDPDSITYTLPDYFGEGIATATDNCTDPVTIFSQTPAPGTLLLDGTYTITLTATDAYGNESTCSFELTVDTILGRDDNRLDFSSLTMYPNPAEYTVTIGNPKFMAIDNITVYDLQGRLVLSKNTAGAMGNQTLEVGHLASAVYMVVIESNGKQVVKRLIRK